DIMIQTVAPAAFFSRSRASTLGLLRDSTLQGDVMRPRRWHHTSLAVTDIDLAVAFYRDAFGFEVLFEERGMAAQIASMTGVPDLVCDLVQMRSVLSEQVLEFIAFRKIDG